ncbi:MAG: hypothetical protein ACFN4F_04075, partial [Porphyromonas endodontalis]|uniref:hypothetical protein n=1 Tax=Porphyromonas endodontalis TaxID=28124 RepID=UPI003605B576
RKYKLFEFNHPGASPRVDFVYLSVALTTGKYKPWKRRKTSENKKRGARLPSRQWVVRENS